VSDLTGTEELDPADLTRAADEAVRTAREDEERANLRRAAESRLAQLLGRLDPRKSPADGSGPDRDPDRRD
jgi:membrane protein involved in colicin uptake